MTDPVRGLRATIRQIVPIPLHADLACGRGEVLALVGPSGSGKSTLLRCIAGLHTPLEGRIACDGETWFDAGSRVNLSTARRRIGMVFQHYALFPHLSALENVLEGMDDPGGTGSREREGNCCGRCTSTGWRSEDRTNSPAGSSSALQ